LTKGATPSLKAFFASAIGSAGFLSAAFCAEHGWHSVSPKLKSETAMKNLRSILNRDHSDLQKGMKDRCA
jgi:hypothetical protein